MSTIVIENFDYVVINTGYADRLIKHLAIIQSEIVEMEIAGIDHPENAVVFIHDTNKNYLYKCGASEDYYTIVEMLNDDQKFGSICLPAKNFYDVQNIINILKKLNHCGFFCENNNPVPNKLELETKHRKTDYNDETEFRQRFISVLVMYFDTESG